MSENVQIRSTEHPAEKSQRGLTMAQQVLGALLLGIAVGLFFGDWTVHVQFIGDIYIGLLQMMVLPYIIVALVGGIGKLTVEQAKQLVKYAVIVLLMMWAVIGTFLLLLPLALPDLTSASFYSSSLIEPAQEVNLINIFLPKNIFASLSNNQVPAVVVFCVAMGVALISAKGKEEVFTLIDVLSEAVMRVIKFVVKLTPIGVFAMTTTAAGTMGFEELGRLQGYFILYTVTVLLLGLGVLPGLISSLTPFKYKDVVNIAWSAMALSFAASKVLVALPLIIESIKELFDKYEVKDPNAVTVAEMLVPISYPFPNTGKLLSLFFVPFTAWFVGSPMELGKYPVFLISGLMSYFGNVTVAMPFLLDLMHLPADMFQIFLLTGVYCGRMSDALGAMDLFTFAALVSCASCGLMHIQWRRTLLILAGSIVVFAAILFGVRSYLSSVSEGSYDKDKILKSMQLMEEMVSFSIVKPEPNPVPLKAGQSRLERINQRGIVRVGYDPERLPFSFTNIEGKLVGFDIEMAQRLAQELEVTIEFVPFTFDSLSQDLKDDHFDIGMSGIYGTAEQSGKIRLSDPYMFATMGLVVPDHRDNAFATPAAIRRHDKVFIGLHRSLAGMGVVQVAVSPYRNVELVVLDSYKEFFERRGTGINVDALYTGIESGSSWTLLYPNFQVVTPWAGDYTVPLVYPYSGGEDNQMDEFLDHWVLLKQHDGTTKKAYDYWILGKGSEKPKSRWSIIRNVLGWLN